MADMEIVLVMEGFGVSRVLHSKNQNFKAGDVVTGLTGWEEYSVIHNTAQLRKIQQDHDDENVPIPLSYHACQVLQRMLVFTRFVHRKRGTRFQANMTAYQNLITKSMYDKQLDSGRGTLLHLCDDVVQQEVKEVIISYFILMEQGKATLEDLDMRCEGLKKEEFGVSCNFDVDDAVIKLEKLGIVSRV